tara:strand:- start:101 stop:217 length:117 start_codon:yes stop_codon:yes gene_type:complete
MVLSCSTEEEESTPPTSINLTPEPEPPSLKLNLLFFWG